MNELKVCFIGIGSIARRHIRNLIVICEKMNIKLSIDAIRISNMNRLCEEMRYIRNIYTDFLNINDIYDAIFITNPTEFHIDTLKRASLIGKNFFIEKPISTLNQLNMINKLQINKNSVYYVACPLRYNAVIQYIKNSIDLDKIISVRSISSSYLPEWRPEIDYRSTYSSSKALGGGVSIDLIHEWDYITYLFGKPSKINCMMGKKSNLEIDSDDYAIYISEYANKIVELHLDYFGRKTIREIMLFTQDDTIVGDIANNQLVYLKSGKKIAFDENRDDYQIRELEHFLKMILGESEKCSNLYEAVDILKMTQGKI